MDKKEIHFEGLIDGALSQIYSTQANDEKKWFLLQHIKKSKMKEELGLVMQYNQGKREEDKLDIVTRQVKNAQYDFVMGQISEELANQYVKDNENKNYIRTGSIIQDIPKSKVHNPYSGGRIKRVMDNLRDNSLESYVNAKHKQAKVMTNARLKILAGVMAGLMVLGGSSLALQNMNQPSSSDGFTTTTQTTTTTTIPRDDETRTEKREKFDTQGVSYEDLTCDTYKNSKGVPLYEMDDALYIANVCYNNVSEELKNYNKTASENDRYAFDTTKFTPEMFVGQWERESSLLVNKEDIDKENHKGPFQFGPEAIKEVNEVSMNLTGELIFETEDDLYDPVKACRAAMYFSIKNYQYLADANKDKDITANMVFDTYLFGCGNIRGQLSNGTYSPYLYSQHILGYSEVFGEYAQQLKQGKTNGLHDEYWRKCVNGLAQVEEYLQQSENQPN